MQERFGLVTGLSDHTVDNTTVITSVALGSSIIEEHVTLDRNGGGPDDSFSLESEELKQLCLQVKIACKTFEKVDCSIKSREQANVKFRRSLYFVKDIKKGEVITKEHVKSIRPGYGLPPKYLNKVIGKKSKYAIAKGSAVTNELIVI